jgi:hypothetical protein
MNCVVALGQNSGREIKIGKSMSMDWIIAKIENDRLIEYVGVEVQSIDITGNYRDNWNAYSQLATNPLVPIPDSEHGLNWANVHKRLIPQLIRKGLIYSRSDYVSKGLYFVLPDRVYREFEKIIGKLPECSTVDSTTMTVFTYDLGAQVEPGLHRPLQLTRSIKFSLTDFSSQFIAGADLPRGVVLDQKIKDVLDLR